MAAPASTARQPPTGIRLDDGFSTVIAFARAPAICFWEKMVKPPGVDGGDKVETTTMHNTAWRTANARHLRTLTDSTTKVAYNPKLYTDILALVNQAGAVTVHFPDGSTLDFFGYLQKFEPDDLEEGKQPEATVTIVPTNYDPVNRVEASPVYTDVAGT